MKAACVTPDSGRGRQDRVASMPFEIWREKHRLPEVLHTIFFSVAGDIPAQAMAVTMTAELSDVFATKREGVLFILENVKSCFPQVETHILSVSGEFVPLLEAQARPLDFAAANWRASAQWISRKYPDCLLVDVGSTTTDILPILNGKVRVSGCTDMARLSSGELVFTGVLRTNLAAIVQSVPAGGRMCRVASEYFSVSGDVHLILGRLQPQDYSCSTPDGRPPSIDSARKRLARLVCADAEMLSTSEIDEMARYICSQQVRQIREGMEQVISRLPTLRSHPAITMGAGAFLAAEAARGLGLKILELENDWGQKESTTVPCLAAAHLLAELLKAESK